MGADEGNEAAHELSSEGDSDDGRGTTWRCGTRAVGNCRRVIAPGGRRAPIGRLLIPTAVVVVGVGRAIVLDAASPPSSYENAFNTRPNTMQLQYK